MSKNTVPFKSPRTQLIEKIDYMLKHATSVEILKSEVVDWDNEHEFIRFNTLQLRQVEVRDRSYVIYGKGVNL